MTFKQKCFKVLREKKQIYTTSKGELKRILQSLRGEGISVRVEKYRGFYLVKENELGAKHKKDIDIIKDKVYSIYEDVMDGSPKEEYYDTDAREIMAEELINDLRIDAQELNVEKLKREEKEKITGNTENSRIKNDYLVENFNEETTKNIVANLFDSITNGGKSKERTEDLLTRNIIKWFE